MNITLGKSGDESVELMLFVQPNFRHQFAVITRWAGTVWTGDSPRHAFDMFERKVMESPQGFQGMVFGTGILKPLSPPDAGGRTLYLEMEIDWSGEYFFSPTYKVIDGNDGLVTHTWYSGTPEEALNHFNAQIRRTNVAL